MGRADDKVWYLMRGDARRGPFSAADLRRFAADHGMAEGDTFTREGLDTWYPIAVLADHVARWEGQEGEEERAAPVPKAQGSRSARLWLLLGCGGLLGLGCLGVCGGAGVWFYARSVGDGPRSATDAALDRQDDDPAYLTSLTAAADELIAGSSTDLAVTTGGVRFVQPALWLDWQSGCGAVMVDPADPRKARFFAPNEPGWCTVEVSLSTGNRVIDTHSLALLVTPETASLTELDP